jgi:hypothetical protein
MPDLPVAQIRLTGDAATVAMYVASVPKKGNPDPNHSGGKKNTYVRFLEFNTHARRIGDVRISLPQM